MDLRLLSSVLSILSSCVLRSALPTAEAPAAAQEHHARTKRCSCATFLDKECVYFCHLDIIWVNTPERVVSYGLGSAARTKRALAETMATGGARCRCFRQKDNACRRFCRLRPEAPEEEEQEEEEQRQQKQQEEQEQQEQQEEQEEQAAGPRT